MPAAEEKLQEKVPFDVYAMMLIVSSAATLTAICLLWAELRKNWYAAEVPVQPKAVYLTYLNEPVEEGAPAGDWVVVNKTDLEDAQALSIKAEVKEFPAWMDPLKRPIRAELDADNTGGVPPEELNRLKDEYLGQKDPTVEAPVVERPPAP
jgi:hypothetical protein